jgi:hypothetical protein
MYDSRLGARCLVIAQWCQSREFSIVTHDETLDKKPVFFFRKCAKTHVQQCRIPKFIRRRTPGPDPHFKWRRGEGKGRLKGRYKGRRRGGRRGERGKGGRKLVPSTFETKVTYATEEQYAFDS